jgi:hypothetical protein
MDSLDHLKYEIYDKSLGFIGTSGMFMASLFFFDLNLSSFEIIVLGYVFILLVSGLIGLLTGKLASKRLMVVYKWSVLLALLANISLFGLFFYLLIDILTEKIDKCSLLIEFQCKHTPVLLVAVFLALYVGITAETAFIMVEAIKEAKHFIQYTRTTQILYQAI